MMNKSQILKKIGNIIEELSEQQQYLASVNKINLLELELFTANADFLIDHIEILKKLNDKRYDFEPQIPQNVEPKPEVVQPAEVKVELRPEIIQIEEEEKPRKFSFSFDEEPTEMVFEFEKKIAVEEVFDRPLNNDEKRFLSEKSSVPEPKATEFIVLDEKTADSGTIQNKEEEFIEPYLITDEQRNAQAYALAEQQKIEAESRHQESVLPEFTKTAESQDEIYHPNGAQPVAIEQEYAKAFPADSPSQNSEFIRSEPIVKEERRLTLNEMLSAKLKQGSVNYQRKKMDDLKAAISINDKMVFIKELFNGYNLAYSEAIEIVNRFDSFDAADNFLQKNYAVKNDWENKQITVARFYEYLQQKFVM